MEFLNLKEITIEVSALIGFISLIRRLFSKQLNPNIRYFLWFFVSIRILFPFKLNFSLELPGNWVETPFRALVEQVETEGKEENENFGQNNSPEINQNPGREKRDVVSALPNVSSRKIAIRKPPIFFLFWLCGVVLMVLWVLLNNLKMYMELKARRREIKRLSNGIILYAVDGFNCLTGILFPAIYIDIDGIKDPAVVKNVIRHELQHYRVRDNYWQFLRVLCLILQWHNPFMWWAYFACQKDCEMACDARVVRGMSGEERYGYGNSLLAVLECAIRKKERISFHTFMGKDKKFISKRIEAIMKYKPEKRRVLSIIIIMVIGCGCLISLHVHGEADASVEKWKAVQENTDMDDSVLADGEIVPEDLESKGNKEEETEGEDDIEADRQTTAETNRPTKSEVFAARELVLEGMSEEEIENLKENIKVANLRMESAFLWDNIFGKLEDPESLYWNYFNEKGEIQIGWKYSGGYLEMKNIMEKENLSQEEFYSQYGTPVTAYSRFDARNFIELIDEMKSTVKNEKLQDDLQKLIDETELAAQTHEVEHAYKLYQILHDMDYYLLRYGLEDVGKYVKDNSTISKYYGVLSIYD